LVGLKFNPANHHGDMARLRQQNGKIKFQTQKLNSYSDYLSVVIALSMGSNKKKPMTKKEREEKRRKHKEKRLKK
jgi:hypothetical protein